MTEEELMAVIRMGIDRVASLHPDDREPALHQLRTSAERIALLLGFHEVEAKRFVEDLVAMLQASVPAVAPPEPARTLH